MPASHDGRQTLVHRWVFDTKGSTGRVRGRSTMKRHMHAYASEEDEGRKRQKRQEKARLQGQCTTRKEARRGARDCRALVQHHQLPVVLEH
jgi:hypothetical protein